MISIITAVNLDPGFDLKISTTIIDRKAGETLLRCKDELS
jgi:hypothetical protein